MQKLTKQQTLHELLGKANDGNKNIFIFNEVMQIAKLVEECVLQGLDGKDAVTSVGLLFSSDVAQFAKFLH